MITRFCYFVNLKYNFTPEEPVWMTGYAVRTKPAEGKMHYLGAKKISTISGYPFLYYFFRPF